MTDGETTLIVSDRLANIKTPTLDDADALSFTVDDTANGRQKTISFVSHPAEEKCAHCGTEKQRIRLCKGCFNIAYCSVSCQKCDWSAHKDACKRLDKKKKSSAAEEKEKWDSFFSVNLFAVTPSKEVSQNLHPDTVYQLMLRFRNADFGFDLEEDLRRNAASRDGEGDDLIFANYTNILDTSGKPRIVHIFANPSLLQLAMRFDTELDLGFIHDALDKFQKGEPADFLVRNIDKTGQWSEV